MLYLANVLQDGNSLLISVCLIPRWVFVKDFGDIQRCQRYSERSKPGKILNSVISKKWGKKEQFLTFSFEFPTLVFRHHYLMPLTATINGSEVSPQPCLTSLFCPARTSISNLLTLRAAKENENLCEKDKSIPSSYSYSAKQLICM